MCDSSPSKIGDAFPARSILRRMPWSPVPAYTAPSGATASVHTYRSPVSHQSSLFPVGPTR